MEVLLGKTLAELQQAALSVGLPKFAGKQLAEWLYLKRVTTFDEMTNISIKGRAALASSYSVGRHAPVAEAVSVDGTRKYLFQVSLPTDNTPIYVESVYIPEDDRATLCVSTQAGCKMGCRFCMTGTLGFHGNLPASEILNQIFYFELASNDSSAPSDFSTLHPLTNLVYMGEGEPMDNLDNVLLSIDILTSAYGLAWSPKRITVSSVGYLPGIKRFLDSCECHLAISLHNPFAVERQEIMPAERPYPMSDVLHLLRQYDFSHQRRVSFEYICWSGKNDTPRHAKELLRILRGLDCRINLIRFHEGVEDAAAQQGKETCNLSSLFPASDIRQMEWLRDYLTANGITTTIRRSRGEDILAACGMLVNSLQKEQQ